MTTCEIITVMLCLIAMIFSAYKIYKILFQTCALCKRTHFVYNGVIFVISGCSPEKLEVVFECDGCRKENRS